MEYRPLAPRHAPRRMIWSRAIAGAQSIECNKKIPGASPGLPVDPVEDCAASCALFRFSDAAQAIDPMRRYLCLPLSGPEKKRNRPTTLILVGRIFGIPIADLRWR